ncbi:MAG TPA: AAA family ATPase [Myxococcota bacterium]|nr:AAA family ATPase [Myxococcota bacterium]
MALRVNLLGGLELFPDEQGEALVLSTRKGAALLAYLACPPGRAHGRNKLAALLWSDRPDTQARASLRQELYALRRELAPFESEALCLRGDSLSLTPKSVEVDVLRFQRLVSEGTPPALEAAMALYRGDFLEGVAPDAPLFEEWLVIERERWREQAAEALAKLFAHQRGAGEIEAALQTGLRLLAFEPGQELVHRAVIRLQLRLGRRGAALRQYKLCLDILKRELGVEPEAETKQLYQEILRPVFRPGHTARQAPGERLPSQNGAVSPDENVSTESLSVFDMLARLPFSGRRGELLRLERRLDAARLGKGGVAFLVGEPGIGKTRLLEEFAAKAAITGATVLWGRCHEGELSRPFGPFAEAIASHATESDVEALREDVGSFGGIVAKIAPELRKRLPDLPEPVALTPEEERHRLLDAVAQMLWAVARRAPLVLVLDDLHWADGGTLVLLRHLARFLPRRPVFLLGAYRDVELARSHPLQDVLVALRREAELEQIALSGLDSQGVTELLEALARHEVPADFAKAITSETGGNPFFLREVLLHLLEDTKIEFSEGRFTSRFSIDGMGIPQSLRQVIGRRLSRLSEETNRLLANASGCPGGFRFEIAAAVADLDERAALDALDSALEAQLLCTTGDPEVYDFTHALIRHTLYDELNPARRVRLHRRLAEEMERRYAEHAAEPALEIAQQWHRSAALPDADRGVVHCLVAADRAERAAAHEEAATALRMALDLLPASDARRPRLLARLGLALAWGVKIEEAVGMASEAGKLIAASEGSDAAADYLADAAGAVYGSSYDSRAWTLAEEGLRHAGTRRDLTWARLAAYDLERHEASDPDFPGLPLNAPQRREVSNVLLANTNAWFEHGVFFLPSVVFDSRQEAIARAGLIPQVMADIAGEYIRASALANQLAAEFAARGQLAPAVFHLVLVARCESALGRLARSREALAQATGIADRVGTPFVTLLIHAVAFGHTATVGEGYGCFLPVIQQLLAADTQEIRWATATVWASGALVCAHEQRADDTLQALERVLPAVERAAGWAPNYTATIYWAIEALWMLERCDHADVLEHNLREKTLAPDFRCPHTDARLALARLCALTGRFDEAREWFEKARHVLDEQGARPLRAITDFDEACMEVRRGRDGNRERTLALLDAARGHFEQIGMLGWLRKADELRKQIERR